MTSDSHKIDQRSNLLLANIQTVREVRRATSKNGYLWDGMKTLMVQIRSEAYHQIRKLKNWSFEEEPDWGNFKLFPRSLWKVSKGSRISIEVNYELDLERLPPKGNPWVGLYVPETWKGRERFARQLRGALSHDLKRLWDEPEDVWPIIGYMRLEGYANGTSFDSDRFIKDAVKRVSMLVEYKPTIDGILKRVAKR